MKFGLMLLIFISLTAFGKQPTKSDLTTAFYKNILSQKVLSSSPNDQCYPRPDITSCVKTICSKLSSFGCDTEEELRDVAFMCRGNFGGNCIQETCSNLSSFECDDSNEIREIAQSCSQVYGNSCTHFYISHLSIFEHDTRDEIVNINNKCKEISPEVVECANYVCGKLSSFSCDQIGELSDTIKTCSGNY